MRRIAHTLGALALATSLGATAAHAFEGPGMTAARQLDMTTQHLAVSADREMKAGRIDAEQARRLEDFAAVARGFRFDLEHGSYTSIQAQKAWAEVSQSFLAARNALGDRGSTLLRNEVLRVHSLMNRIDLRFGGPAFRTGKNGYPG
jgi:hypothetical protein